MMTPALGIDIRSWLWLLCGLHTSEAFGIIILGGTTPQRFQVQEQQKPQQQLTLLRTPPSSHHRHNNLARHATPKDDDKDNDSDTPPPAVDETTVLGAQGAASALILDELTEGSVEYDLMGTEILQENMTEVTTAAGEIVEAPPLSFQKFLTMQGKRVIVTIRYSGEAGLKPYFLTAAKKIKASHPDVILERRQMADLDPEDPNDEPSFEILVDGKVIVGNNKSRSRKKIGNVHTSIFVSMQELDLAISRARRRRRPSTTVYGEVHEPSDLRLDGLRDGTSVVKVHGKHHEWND